MKIKNLILALSCVALTILSAVSARAANITLQVANESLFDATEIGIIFINPEDDTQVEWHPLTYSSPQTYDFGHYSDEGANDEVAGGWYKVWDVYVENYNNWPGYFYASWGGNWSSPVSFSASTQTLSVDFVGNASSSAAYVYTQ